MISKKIDLADFSNALKSDITNNWLNKKFFPYYSIKEICKIYPFISKGPGQWYSNYDLIAIIQCITTKYQPLLNTKIINFPEGIVYISKIIEECFEKTSCLCSALSFEQFTTVSSLKGINNTDFEIVEKYESFKTECQCFKNAYYYSNDYYVLKNQFLMFLSVRHGLYDLEEEYIKSIYNFFNIKHNLGIIGGKNQRALYFIGYNRDNLICLDPHFVQTICDLKSIIRGNGRETYKPSYFSVDINQISPSFSLGFYCQNIEDFKILITQTIEHSRLENPLFSVKT